MILQNKPIEKGIKGGETMQITALNLVVAAVIIILSIAAVKTAIPNSQASKPCLLGYKATCSFTPISTAILILVAIITFLVTKNMIMG
jgi:hypothetical protein